MPMACAGSRVPTVTELANVAQQPRRLEPEFLRGDNAVDERFLNYVRPLVGELPRPVRLSDRPVAKKLGLTRGS